MSGPGLVVPREHGAYGQIAFPLITAFLVGGMSSAGLLLAVAVIAGFLAHEPAAVVLGHRGSRAQRERGGTAARWLVCCLAFLVAAGAAAVALIPSSARWSLAVPAAPVLLLAVAMIRGREKSWYGEVATALAFSGVVVPVMLAAGARLDAAWIVATTFALLFVATTLAVRAVILRVRGGGNAPAAAAARRFALAISLAAIAVTIALTVTGRVASSLPVSAAPGLCAAAVLAARPPPATRVRAIGWTLIAVSCLTLGLLVATV
jgi:YwiC-like protein